MPEISLKAYFTRLNSLLSVNSADEVIHHARHILQTYPKNVTAYRFLGRALVLNGRWDEGREALRRVLSVYPDDYIAHLGLSEANEHLNHPDEAVWHLERAYEQNPNNKDIIDALRGLYRRYRNIENPKMPLTSAAVARQYARSGAYTQAIDTLRSARARMNDRLDLKLLLAHLLWEHGTQQGAKEEAGEIAVDVLKVLPDCLEANRIMSKLWLSMGLPSDAQRYVNHLEAVDPYLAIEVVQGSAPDDDVFRLEELDYVRTSASEMASARPDWLQEISTSPAPVLETEAESAGDDWTNWTSVLLGNQGTPAATPPAEPPASPRYSRFVEDDDEELPAYEAPSTGGLTDLFGSPNSEAAEELAELFAAPAGSDVDDDQDPMAWMRDAGIEMVDEDDQPNFDDLFAAEANSGTMPNMDINPMAWLEQSNSDFILEQSEPQRPAIEDESDFSWMRDELLDEEPEPSAPTYDEQPQLQADDAFDWMQADHLLDEALSLEGHLSGDFGDTRKERESSAFDAGILDGQDDMFEPNVTPAAESEIPSFEETAAPESGSVPGPRRGLTAILQEANFDWMGQEQPESVSDLGDDWLNQFGPAEPRKTATDTPDWLTDLEPPAVEADESDEDDEWFKSDEIERLTLANAVADMSSFAQMSDEEPPKDDEDSDWLAEFAPEEDAEAETENPNDDTGALPDWLTELAPAAAAATTTTPEDDYPWMAEADEVIPAADEDPALADWLAELKPDEADNEPVAADTADDEDEPDDFSWMNDAALTQAEAVVGASAAVGAIDWLSELEPEDERDGSSEEAAVGSEQDDYTWMTTEDEPEAVGQDAAPAVAGDVPDWLSELGQQSEAEWDSEEAAEPAAEAEPVALEAEDYSWMSSLEDETDVALETIPAPEPAAESELNWLSELEADADEVEPEAVVAEADLAAVANPEEDYHWMRDDAEPEVEAEVDWTTEAAASAIPADDIDWLSELQTEAEADAAEAEAEPVAESGTEADDYTWMNEISAEAAGTGAAVGEIDWTSELEVESGSETDDYPWMQDEAEAEAEEALPVAAGDMPDWLSELEPASDVQEEAAAPEPVAASVDLTDEELAWLVADDEPEAETADEPEPVVAGDVPDWLSELAPPSGMEAVAETDAESAPAAITDEELAWMVADDEPAPEADAEPEPEVDVYASEPAAEAETEPESTLPDWLRDAMPVAAAVTADAVASAEFDDADEIEENEDQFAASLEDDDVLEPTPASNAPDWLNAMVPGLDVDYDAPEDEWIDEDDEASFGADEREYAWVEQMVEEEMAQVEAPAFAFTRPPAWFASLGEGGGGAMDGDDDFPDWVSDDGEADLPEYLR